MTDSPTSQAMHLAMTELKEREQRIAELEEVLRRAQALLVHVGCWDDVVVKDIRSVLNKETNRV